MLLDADENVPEYECNLPIAMLTAWGCAVILALILSLAWLGTTLLTAKLHAPKAAAADPTPAETTVSPAFVMGQI